jgi:LPXTG-motif cell wall-anchored protein
MASVAIFLGLAPVAILANSAQAITFHGITALKSCEGTTPVGEAYVCSYKLINSDDNSESIQVASVNDVVHAAAGNVNSGNILLTLNWTFTGGASCGGGVCTLPVKNSSMQSDPFSFYEVKPADFGLPNHLLDDTVTVSWSEPECAHGGCPVGPQTGTTGASTTVTKTQPTIVTQLSKVGTVPIGTSVTDQAVINGAAGTAQGTVSYAVYSDVQCTHLVKDLGTKSVDGTVDPSDPYVTDTAGNFWFQASYSGDDSNLGGKSACETEPLSVKANTVTTEGTTVTTESVSTSPATTEAPTTVAAQAELPKTGSSTGVGIGVGTVLLLSGAALIGSQRRRRQTRP